MPMSVRARAHAAGGGRLVAHRAVRAQDPRGAHLRHAPALRLRQRGDGAYFRRRLDQAPRDADFALAYVQASMRHAREAGRRRRRPALQVRRAVGSARRPAPRLCVGGGIPIGAFAPEAMSRSARATHDRIERGSPTRRCRRLSGCPSTGRATAGCCWRPSGCCSRRRSRSPIMQLCDGDRSCGRDRRRARADYNAPSETHHRRRTADAAGTGRPGRGRGVNVQTKPVDDQAPRPCAADRAAGRADPSLPAAVPLLLQPAGAGARDRRARRPRRGSTCWRGRRARRPAAPPLRRRADRAPRPGGDRRAGGQVGLYSNLITAGVLLDARAARGPCRARPRPRAALDPGRRAGHRRSHRRLRRTATPRSWQVAGWARAPACR